MNTSMKLLIIIFVMHFLTLINITIFDGEWNGFHMFFSTGLFILAIAFYAANRKKRKQLIR